VTSCFTFVTSRSVGAVVKTCEEEEKNPSPFEDRRELRLYLFRTPHLNAQITTFLDVDEVGFRESYAEGLYMLLSLSSLG
jgi:hypothetical protein